MLLAARILGEVARKIKLPSVTGELAAGLILGKTLLGHYFPETMDAIFPAPGKVPIALNGITSLSVIMLLFVAGMEVELGLVRREGRKAILTSLGGFSIPMVIGLSLGFYQFGWFGVDESEKKIFSLFLGTALSITALPVVARILIDLGLFKTNVGSVVISSAMLDDLIGWLVFSVILGLINERDTGAFEVWQTVGLTVVYMLFILTVAKWVIDRILPWFQKRLSWPGGVLSLAFGLCFMGAAFTEYIGIHAIFGAFIMGIAFGDSVHLTTNAREIIHQFVTNIFAPLFFVAIGLRLNFAAYFDLWITVLIIGAAILSKLTGATLGAKLGGMKWKEALAVGFGMNARGAMEIILATLALEAGLIHETLFVSLVIMAIVTSVLSGPMLAFFCRDIIINSQVKSE